MAINDLIKGANKSRLSFVNAVSVLKTLLLFACGLLFVINIGCFWYCTTAYERYTVWRYVTARLQMLTYHQNSKISKRNHNNDYGSPNMRWKMPSGAMVIVRTQTYLDNPFVGKTIKNTLRILQQGWRIAYLATSTILLIWIVWLIRRGKRSASREHVKGAKRLPVRQLNRRLRRAGQRSSLTIGNSFYVKNTEVEHLLCVGGSGNGKTTFLLNSMENAAALGHKHVIFDLDGEFVSHFYRPGKDIILSLRDARSPAWNFFSECDSVFDVEKRAKSMVPTGKQGGEQWFWNYLSQIIFSSVASQLFEKGKTKTADLLSYLYAVDRETIQSLLKGTLAEAYVAKGMEKMTGSIKGVLSVYINSLRYVRDSDKNPQDFFSITNWVKDNTNSDSRLFISVQEDDFELFRPVIAFWLDTAVSAALSLEKDHRRRIWFRFDEVATLGHLPSLIAGLTKGRKKGLCFVLGAQSLSQFRDNYSQAQTDIIFDNCHTKLYFAIEGADTAKWAAADMGEQECEEVQEGVSVSSHHKNSNNLSSSQQVRTLPVINYTEIKCLPKLTAFLSLPGDWPITQVKFKPFAKTPVNQPLMNLIVEPVKPTAVNNSYHIQSLENRRLRYKAFLS